MSLSTRLKDLEDQYNATLDETIELVSIEDIKIKDALKNQLPLELSWNALLSKGKHIKDRAEYEMETAYSESIEKELKDSYRSTSISEAREFAKCNQAYKTARILFLDASALYDDIKAAMETVTSRRYVLNNLTNLVVASSENHLL